MEGTGGETRRYEVEKSRNKRERGESERKVVIWLTGGDKAAICFHVRYLGID